MSICGMFRNCPPSKKKTCKVLIVILIDYWCLQVACKTRTHTHTHTSELSEDKSDQRENRDKSRKRKVTTETALCFLDTDAEIENIALPLIQVSPCGGKSRKPKRHNSSWC